MVSDCLVVDVAYDCITGQKLRRRHHLLNRKNVSKYELDQYFGYGYVEDE